MIVRRVETGSLTPICTVCGVTLKAPGAVGGRCAACQVGSPAADEPTRQAAAAPPPAIAGYRFIRELGVGGQGLVWLAIEEAEKRKVALKLLRDDRLADGRARARFEQEYETLMQLEHPNIIRVLARGALDSGVIWHATEYISGKPLNEFVNDLDRDALAEPAGKSDFPLRAVLGLFVRVCDAVQAAHAVGVIHRDLKPANVLVDDAGQPHVLDFGLARPLRATRPTALTLTNEFLGTTAWASPEQVEARPGLIDVRTDVYALGLMLYHALTGCFPYEVEGALVEVFQQIRAAERRRPSAIATFIDDELDTLILKAIARDRERRYASVAALADDLRAYLLGRPIGAKGDSAWYIARKFVQRNRALVGAAATLFVLSVAFGVGMFGMYRTQARERQRADAAAAQAQRITAFVEDMFGRIDPAAARGRTITVVEVLDDAAAAIESQPPGDALVEAGVRKVIGGAYSSIADYEKAAPQLRRAHELFRTALPESDGRRIECAVELAATLVATGALDEARELLEAQLAVVRSMIAEAGEKPELAQNLGSILNGLGECHVREGRPDDAEPHYLEALDVTRRAGPERRADLATIMTNVSQVYMARGEYARVIEALEEALRIRREALPEGHPSLANSLHNLGEMQRRRGQFEAAEDHLLQAERIRRAVLAPRHPELAITLNSLGALYYVQRQLERAEPYFQEALAIRRETLHSPHNDLAESINNVAALLLSTGRHEQAEPLVQEAARAFAELFGEQSVPFAVAAHKLADLRFRCGLYAEAEPTYRQVVGVLRAAGAPAKRLYLPKALFDWARCLARLERWDEVEALTRESLALLEQGPADAVLLAEARGLLGEWLTRAGRFDEAQPPLIQSLETLSQSANVDANRLSQAHGRLVTLYERWGKPDEADRYR